MKPAQLDNAMQEVAFASHARASSRASSLAPLDAAVGQMPSQHSRQEHTQTVNGQDLQNKSSLEKLEKQRNLKEQVAKLHEEVTRMERCCTCACREGTVKEPSQPDSERTGLRTSCMSSAPTAEVSPRASATNTSVNTSIISAPLSSHSSSSPGTLQPTLELHRLVSEIESHRKQIQDHFNKLSVLEKRHAAVLSMISSKADHNISSAWDESLSTVARSDASYVLNSDQEQLTAKSLLDKLKPGSIRGSGSSTPSTRQSALDDFFRIGEVAEVPHAQQPETIMEEADSDPSSPWLSGIEASAHIDFPGERHARQPVSWRKLFQANWSPP